MEVSQPKDKSFEKKHNTTQNIDDNDNSDDNDGNGNNASDEDEDRGKNLAYIYTKLLF